MSRNRIRPILWSSRKSPAGRKGGSAERAAGAGPRSAAPGCRRHLLRHLHVDAHLVNVGDAEQLRSGAAAGAAAGIDERADVGLARGHHAVERRGDVLEACQRLQAVDVALGGIDVGAPWSTLTS